MKKATLLMLAAVVCFAGTAAAEEGGTTISNEKISVEVPEEIQEICEIETGENRISFYEKIAHEAFGGGYVGGICLYENVTDYGDAPNYRRGGEIDYPDGSKLDIVLMLPSDVQYDLSDSDSTQNYHKIEKAFPEIASGITALDDGTFVPQDQIDTTSIYDDVLDRLISDLNDRKDRDALEADGFSYVYAYSYDLEDRDVLDEIGYAFVDVNLDGYKELVIGSVESPFIYDMFAPVDGQAVHVFSGAERSSYALSGNSPENYMEICNQASGGAALSEITYSILMSNRSELTEQVRFIYDAAADEENPWFVNYGFDEENEPLSEDEWNQRMKNFGETLDPGFQPLSSFGSGD